MTFPTTVQRWCTRCGMPDHGSVPCRFNVVGTAPAQPTPLRPGWVCPVCGTGCAPWLPTHCDKPHAAPPEPQDQP